MENERRVLKSAHGFCEGSVPRGREQRVDLDSIYGGWEVRGMGAFWVPREEKWEQWR